MVNRINWTALAGAEQEVIDALLLKESIERKQFARELKAKKAVKQLVVIDWSVAPTAIPSH